MESRDHHQQDAAGPLVDQSAEVAIFREEKAGQDLFQDFFTGPGNTITLQCIVLPCSKPVIET